METNEILVHSTRISRLLIKITVALLVLSLAVQSLYLAVQNPVTEFLYKVFNLDRERNIPTLFSVSMLLACAFLLAAVASTTKRTAAPHFWKWTALSAGFVVMAMDESWATHEKLIGPVKRIFVADTYGVFFFAWVIPGILLVLALVPFFLKFLRDLEPKYRNAFLAAAALYVGGALGMEMVNGQLAESIGTRNLIYEIAVDIEEVLENLGLILFIRSLISYLADILPEWSVRFSAPDR